jgi:hypothetical protein
MKKKRSTSFTLTHEARRLLAKLHDKLGISMAAVVELAIREKADKEKIE